MSDDTSNLDRSIRIHPPVGRGDFVATVPAGPKLEIGPFTRPAFTGPDVRYFDVMSADEIRSEAVRYKSDATLAPKEIHYVARDIALGDIPERFVAVYSSHTIEHTFDCIGHVNDVARCLPVGGRYYLVIPDKRYCFDYFKPTATIGRVIEAAEYRPTEYGMAVWVDRSIIGTHSTPARHWAGDHGELHKPDASARVAAAIREYKSGYRSPMGTHVWCFTPTRFAEIMTICHEIGYTGMKITDLYPTKRDTFEFYAVLEKTDAGATASL